MSKRGFSLVILIVFAIKLLAVGMPANISLGKKSYVFGTYGFYQVKPIDLKKKSYYRTIFTKNEQKELGKADKYFVSAAKYMKQYNSYQKDIEKQYTIAEATSSGKSMSKALKKAKKLEGKALKKGNKALSYYNKAYDIRTKIYATAINRARLGDNSKNAKIGREIELRAKTLFDQANSKVKTAPLHDKQMKFDALKSANDMRLEAFELQEAAFGFYANDSVLSPDDYLKTNQIIVDKDKTVTADTNFFPKYVEQYNPMMDANLYRSKANLILPRLNLTSQELNQIVDANKKNAYANNLMRQVDEIYLVVDSLNMLAEMQNDLSQKDKMKQKAIEKEQNAFYKLLNATNIYLSANEIRYNIYKAHFGEVRPKYKTPETERAALMEREANDYFDKANMQIRSARNLMYRSDQYIKMMGANDLRLYSLQLQESAYGIYLNIPGAVSAKIDTAFVTENSYNDTKKSTKKENTSSKLSWEVLSTYTYSSVKPKPVKYKAKKGVVFSVQLGIFKGLLPPKKFAKVNPIVFDKFVKNPYRRYLVGEYRSFETADLALKYVKRMGYDDAYIISKVNGQRKSYAYGKSKLVFDNRYDNVRIHELSAFSDVSYTNTGVNNPVDDSRLVRPQDNRNVKNVKGLAYYVQLGMFLKKVSPGQFNNISPIYTEKVPSRGTRYMTGPYSTVAQARDAERKIKSSGFADAYVVAYNNGTNISLKYAKWEENPKTIFNQNDQVDQTKTQKSTGGIKFSVQVGAYENKLNNTDYQKLKRSFSPRNVEIKYSLGMNVYIIGDYKTYNEAKYLKNKLHAEGHSDCFIVAFKGTEKIPVSEAIKLSR